jgi:hypothetical protein
VAQAELLEHVRHVGLHRGLADHELLGHFRVRAPKAISSKISRSRLVSSSSPSGGSG